VFSLSVCGNPAGGDPEHSHTFGDEWLYDADVHWKECTECGDPDRAAHIFSTWVIDSLPILNVTGSKHRECTVCEYLEIQTILINITSTKSGIELVLIKAGTFDMGQIGVAEPVHQVTLTKNFYMGKTEVTQKQYLAVMGSYPGAAPSDRYGKGDNYPMYYVSWFDAVQFCNTLSGLEGLTPAYDINGVTVTLNERYTGYRLPTEAEWEYACRAGTKTTYSTGNTISNDTGWYYANSGDISHEVGQKPQNGNAWGLYDMNGNVRDWCWDWYKLYTNSDVTDPAPMGASSGTHRMARGGNWYSAEAALRSANRGFFGPSSRYDDMGFRIVRPL
jgi:formylglycine-generating enzyme required for sulfatase activity